MSRGDRTVLRTQAVLVAFAAIAAAFLLFGALAVGRGAGARAASVPNDPTAGVVDVNTYLGYQQSAAAGTGIVLTATGEVLTNNHVIRGATRIRVVVPATGRTYTATVTGYNLSADVAVLQLKSASGLETATLGNSAGVRLGDQVTAVGNAGGTGGAPTVTSGVVTGLHHSITVGDDQGGSARLTDLIRTDASLEPGDSGGPLLDGSGRVIGIDTAASSRYAFRGGGGGGFAVPINRAKAIVKLIQGARSTATVHVGPTSFLGISVSSSTRAGGAATNGALVSGVLSGSPADRAGLAAGDLITALAGRSVTSPRSLVNALLRTSPGDTLRIRWSDRLGASHTETIRPVAGPPQ